MTLTEKQLQEITGYQRPAFQVKWLRKNGWPFALDKDNRPVVLVSVAESYLGGVVSSAPRVRFDHEAA